MNIYCIIIYKKALFLTIILTMKYLWPASFSFPCLLAVFLTSLFVHFALFYFFLPISSFSLSSLSTFFCHLFPSTPYFSNLFQTLVTYTMLVVHNAFIRVIRIDLYLQTLQTKNKVKFLYPAVVRRWQC